MAPIDERIRELRHRLGLTQKEIGREAGVTNAAVSAWERGITKPERDALLALQHTMRVNPRWILYGEEPWRFPPTSPRGQGAVAEDGGAYNTLADAIMPELLRIIARMSKRRQKALTELLQAQEDDGKEG